MYLMTASLLNSWSYLLRIGGEEAWDSFVDTLLRKPSEPGEAAKTGFAFEEWAEENYIPTWGGCYQVKLAKPMGDFLIYGRLDCLKAGVVYDYKYTGHYEPGKFLHNAQTPIYLTLVPEAERMVYVVTNSKNFAPIYTETYRIDEAPPLEPLLEEFRNWLKGNGLYGTYCENWQAREA